MKYYVTILSLLYNTFELLESRKRSRFRCRSVSFQVFEWKPVLYTGETRKKRKAERSLKKGKGKGRPGKAKVAKKKVVTVKPCLWNGMKRLCYLFARNFILKLFTT
ncbi:unnamed protein product [Musa acuminata var. zebrina]